MQNHESFGARVVRNDGGKNGEERSGKNAVLEKNSGPPVPTEKKLEELRSLIAGIEIAMMTTVASDGSLVSRPMDTQDHAPHADLWFMTTTDTGKLDDIRKDPRVNLAYYKDGEWVSASGRVSISQDRALIRALYKPDWKAWLPDEGGQKDGSPDDPRIVILDVDVEGVTYMKRTQPKPLVLFQLVKAFVTGQPPKIGHTQELSKEELRARGYHGSKH